MANINDLPNETIYHIIAFLEADRRKLCSLSLTCSRLNILCDEAIYRTYRFVIRTSLRPARDPFQPDSDRLRQFSKKVLRARLAHFRAKAPFIRDLVVVDHVSSRYVVFLPDRNMVRAQSS